MSDELVYSAIPVRKPKALSRRPTSLLHVWSLSCVVLEAWGWWEEGYRAVSLSCSFSHLIRIPFNNKGKDIKGQTQREEPLTRSQADTALSNKTCILY